MYMYIVYIEKEKGRERLDKERESNRSIYTEREKEIYIKKTWITGIFNIEI